MAEKFLVGKTEGWKDGMKKRVMAGEQAIMLAFIEGRFFAVQDMCTHAKASLSGGKLDEYKIECPWHGAQFDIRTGQVLVLPAAVALKTFKVEEKAGEIWVEV